MDMSNSNIGVTMLQQRYPIISNLHVCTTTSVWSRILSGAADAFVSAGVVMTFGRVDIDKFWWLNPARGQMDGFTPEKLVSKTRLGVLSLASFIIFHIQAESGAYVYGTLLSLPAFRYSFDQNYQAPSTYSTEVIMKLRNPLPMVFTTENRLAHVQ